MGFGVDGGTEYYTIGFPFTLNCKGWWSAQPAVTGVVGKQIAAVVPDYYLSYTALVSSVIYRPGVSAVSGAHCQVGFGNEAGFVGTASGVIAPGIDINNNDPNLVDTWSIDQNRNLINLVDGVQ